MSRRDEVLKPFLAKRDYMEARIREGVENNRKGCGTIRVTDAAGNAIRGAKIALVQTKHEFLHGANIFMLHQMPTPEKNRMYEDFFCKAFNLATVPFYWNTLEPEQGKPRFAVDSPDIYRRPPPDLCVEFCERHGITPKCHCLNYDQWTPRWAPYGVGEVRRLLSRRMREIAERYADRIPGVEVTNEFLCGERDVDDRHSTANFRTPDVVEWSFETARRYFPNNELIINEASAFIWDKFNYNRTAYYMQIERALMKGAPIDAVGMQYHMFFSEENEAASTRNYYDPERIYAVMDQFAEFGKPLQVTEVTIPAYHETPEDEDLQAEILSNMYSMWFSHKSMEAVVYWNVVDGFAHVSKDNPSWNENYYRGGLIRNDFTPKPAYKVLVDLFTRKWHTEAEAVTGDDGEAAFRGFFGDYDARVTLPDGTVVRERLSLKADSFNRFRFTVGGVTKP